jgi:hypothetical protein
MDLWENVKGFYKEKFDIEPEIVDLFCDFSVLLLCVSGSSNKSISNFLDMDALDVENTLLKYYGFPGWLDDLEINPIRKFKEGTLTSDIQYYEVLEMLCEKFSYLEELLNERWI